MLDYFEDYSNDCEYELGENENNRKYNKQKHINIKVDVKK